MADCTHDWVEVLTYKQIYRHCILCNSKEVKEGEEWH